MLRSVGRFMALAARPIPGVTNLALNLLGVLVVVGIPPVVAELWLNANWLPAACISGLLLVAYSGIRLQYEKDRDLQSPFQVLEVLSVRGEVFLRVRAKIEMEASASIQAVGGAERVEDDVISLMWRYDGERVHFAKGQIRDLTLGLLYPRAGTFDFQPRSSDGLYHAPIRPDASVLQVDVSLFAIEAGTTRRTVEIRPTSNPKESSVRLLPSKG